jgi:hypothetical protein
VTLAGPTCDIIRSCSVVDKTFVGLTPTLTPTEAARCDIWRTMTFFLKEETLI